MGLDIRGYYGVKLVGIREATDEEYEEPLIVVTEYFGAFPDAVKGMVGDCGAVMKKQERAARREEEASDGEHV